MTTIYKEEYKDNTPYHGLAYGQLKLLLSEIQLVLEYINKTNLYKNDVSNNNRKCKIVYAGSAPGTHLLELAKLFPCIDSFDLYDPETWSKTNKHGTRFDSKLYNYKDKFSGKNKFNIYKGDDGMFTDEVAKSYTKSNNINLIFISDIRPDSIGQQKELDVHNNMNEQLEWIRIMKPYMSLVKFRMHYDISYGYTIVNNQPMLKYCKGKLLYGIYAPPDSAETRLLINKEDISKECMYSYHRYTKSLYNYNSYKRPFVDNMLVSIIIDRYRKMIAKDKNNRNITVLDIENILKSKLIVK